MRNNHLGAVSSDTLLCFANAQVQVDLFQMTRYSDRKVQHQPHISAASDGPVHRPDRDH